MTEKTVTKEKKKVKNKKQKYCRKKIKQKS